MSQKPLKKFEVDENFQPCPVMDDDELCPNGIFVFNITKMKTTCQMLNYQSQ